MTQYVGVRPVSSAPYLLTTGEEAYSREIITNTSITLITGRVHLIFWTARKAGTTSNVVFLSAAAGATNTLARIGVYSVDAAGALTLVGSSASDTALFTVANTRIVKALSSPFARVLGQRYATALLCVGGTMPSVGGRASGGQTQSEWFQAPMLTAGATAADLPATIPLASLSTITGAFYAAVS